MFSIFILKLSFFTSLIVICGAAKFSTFAVIFFVFPLSLVILNTYAPFLFTVYTFSVALVSVFIVASYGASIPVIVPSVILAVTFISTVPPSNTYPV